MICRTSNVECCAYNLGSLYAIDMNTSQAIAHLCVYTFAFFLCTVHHLARHFRMWFFVFNFTFSKMTAWQSKWTIFGYFTSCEWSAGNRLEKNEPPNEEKKKCYENQQEQKHYKSAWCSLIGNIECHKRDTIKIAYKIYNQQPIVQFDQLRRECSIYAFLLLLRCFFFLQSFIIVTTVTRIIIIIKVQARISIVQWHTTMNDVKWNEISN